MYQSSLLPPPPFAGLDSDSTPPFFLPFTRGHVQVRVLSRGVEYLEKCGKYLEANQLLGQLLSQDIYASRRRGKWWDRRALNWDYHLKDRSKVHGFVAGKWW